MITHAQARASARRVQEPRDEVARLRKGPITFEFVRTGRVRPSSNNSSAARAAGTVSPQLANDMLLGLTLGRRH